MSAVKLAGASHRRIALHDLGRLHSSKRLLANLLLKQEPGSQTERTGAENPLKIGQRFQRSRFNRGFFKREAQPENRRQLSELAAPDMESKRAGFSLDMHRVSSKAKGVSRSETDRRQPRKPDAPRPGGKFLRGLVYRVKMRIAPELGDVKVNGFFEALGRKDEELELFYSIIRQ